MDSSTLRSILGSTFSWDPLLAVVGLGMIGPQMRSEPRPAINMLYTPVNALQRWASGPRVMRQYQLLHAAPPDRAVSQMNFSAKP